LTWPATRRALAAVDHHKRFGFNYDPSHLGYQGVDYIGFIGEFGARIHHVHMKDVYWSPRPTPAGVFGGHLTFGHAIGTGIFVRWAAGGFEFEAIIGR
jgi:sugar phosphate isomerase/epimerase